MIDLQNPYISGIFLCAVLAIFAHVLSFFIGGPYMVYALVIGMMVGSVVYKQSTPSNIWGVGIDYTGKKLLRIGVALLGARITFAEISALGFDVVWALCASVVATIVFGAVVGKVLGVGIRMGVLTGGSTAICGASAAMAVASVLPQDKKLQQQTLFTVVGVNVLSTVAMILYPLIAIWLGYDVLQAGIFLGGSIHDVAQVVGAGLSMSDAVGNIATISKLLRVALLLPVVFGVAGIVYWLSRGGNSACGGEANAPFPFFLLGFLVLVALNSMGGMAFTVGADMTLSVLCAKISKGLLTMAVIALGMKTSFYDIVSVGYRAMVLLILETVFIAGLVLAIRFSFFSHPPKMI